MQQIDLQPNWLPLVEGTFGSGLQVDWRVIGLADVMSNGGSEISVSESWSTIVGSRDCIISCGKLDANFSTKVDWCCVNGELGSFFLIFNSIGIGDI